MEKVRQPAVAGQFYPADPERLRRTVTGFLEEASAPKRMPKGIIAPHAGYIYSGPIAGSAYAQLVGRTNEIQRVILLGPAHRVAVRGLAASSAHAFATPLGDVPLDREAIERALTLPQVAVRDDAHEEEHGLEVQLPFLQQVCAGFSLVPLLVGNASPSEVAEVLHLLWGGPETLVVVSSDLSHYLDYEAAKETDHRTAEAIQRMEPDKINKGGACGRIPIQGLLKVAAEKGLAVETADLRNSGDTAGPRSQVVGYGAFLFS